MTGYFTLYDLVDGATGPYADLVDGATGPYADLLDGAIGSGGI